MKKVILATLLLVNLAVSANAPSDTKSPSYLNKRYENFVIAENIKILHAQINTEIKNEKDVKLLNYLFTNTEFGDQDVQLKLKEVSDSLSVNPLWVLRVIYKESRGNTKAVNTLSNATGIIQWLPSTARALNTSILCIYNMNTKEQLDLLLKFAIKSGKVNKIKSYEDMYLLVFHPASVGKPDDHILGKFNSKTTKSNKGVDLNNNGIITIREFKKYANI